MALSPHSYNNEKGTLHLDLAIFQTTAGKVIQRDKSTPQCKTAPLHSLLLPLYVDRNARRLLEAVV